jgi:putative FmdB family regulatory protein
MPLYVLRCGDCNHEWEEIYGVNEARQGVDCPKCNREKSATITPAGFGGYSIKGNNSASVRPKQAGSFRGKK